MRTSAFRKALWVMVMAVSLSWPVAVLSADSVKFTLGWVPIGRDAAFYVSQDKGYYKAANLNVTIERGFGGADVVKKVAAGAFDYGFGDIPSLIIARSKGTSLKALGSYHSKSMYVLFAMKKSGISQPKGLEGKTIGTSAGDSGRAIFPAFASINKIELSKVKWQTMAPGVIISSLLSGSVDAVSLFYVSGPALWRAAKAKGEEVNAILYADHGVDIYSSGIIATDATIQSKRDATRRFIEATYKGIGDMVKDPGGAVESYLKFHKTGDKEIARQQVDITNAHLVTDTAKKMGLGFISEKKMAYTRDLITKYMNLSKKVPVKELYTNEFLPKILP